jgi:hypothetical protein
VGCERTLLPVGSNQQFLQIMEKKLPPAAVGKDKTVILKGLNVKVTTGHLLQEGSH